jgi:hypothetical protein
MAIDSADERGEITRMISERYPRSFLSSRSTVSTIEVVSEYTVTTTDT